MYSGHMSIEISASEFTGKCLALLVRVAATGETLVVTKRGKPVARVVPPEPPPSLKGSVTFHVSDEELVRPLDERWNAEIE